MTEQEWHECTDPKKLLDYLPGSDSKSERKLRLLAVACCYSIWPLVSDDRLKNAVLATEYYADGLATDDVRQ